MSDIKEVAKATAELAKFGTKSIEVTEKSISFLAKVFGEPINDCIGIIGDK